MGEPGTTIRAAGAVLWRVGPRGREVALIHRPRYQDWTLPKGKLKPGEHVLRAAVREVYEETGARPILGRRMSPQRYLKNGRPKQVEWWSAVPAAEPQFTPGEEVDRLEWLPVREATARLTWPRDLPVLRDFATGPADTVPLIVLRHASAGGKREEPYGDELRPLDVSGRAAAMSLADLLAGFGTARVVTSATARCVETVLPYVHRTGADVRVEEAFTVRPGAGGPAQVSRAREVLLALIEEAVPTIVCTHGELAPALTGAACGRLSAPAPGDPALSKGAFWALHAAYGRPASIEHHAP